MTTFFQSIGGVHPTELKPNNECLEVMFWLKGFHLGVSKNRGTPKWIVYNGKPYWNGWFGGTTIFGNIHLKLFISGVHNPCHFTTFSTGVYGIHGRFFHYLLLTMGCLCCTVCLNCVFVPKKTIFRVKPSRFSNLLDLSLFNWGKLRNTNSSEFLLEVATSNWCSIICIYGILRIKRKYQSIYRLNSEESLESLSNINVFLQI